MPLLKGEKKHEAVKGLLFPTGLGLGREGLTRRPGKWRNLAPALVLNISVQKEGAETGPRTASGCFFN